MINKSWPKISIVTPNYNCVQFLEKTILSVLSQGYPNLEYIVVDGGSNDGSIDVIRKYEKQLSYWVSEKDKGMYDALNKGFKQSSGEIMAWINSDDMLWPGSLTYIATTFKNNPHVKWIQGLPSVINEEDELILQMDYAYSKFYFLTGLYKNPFYTIQQESTFWKRSLWEKAGGRLDTQFKLAGDFDLWIRYFIYEPLYCSERQLGAFRKRKGQQSEDVTKYISESEASIKKHIFSNGIVDIIKILIFKVITIMYNRTGIKKILGIQKRYSKKLIGQKKVV